jgi:hypothetical protein
MSEHETLQMIREAMANADTQAWADMLAHDQCELVMDVRHGGRIEVRMAGHGIRSWALRHLG